MIHDQWLLGLLIVAVVVHAVATYRLRRHRLENRPGADRADEGAEAVDPDAGTVDCPQCGTENEPGYRYCRSCVCELPGDVGFETEARSPGGHLTR